MGMESRGYGYRVNWGGIVTPAVKMLLIANTSVFLLQTVLQLFGGYRLFLEWFGLIPAAVVPLMRVWQPFTYLFLHGGLGHLLINMLVLWMFGCDLERTWGRRRFLFYYFLTGVGAGLLNVFVKLLFFPAGHPSLISVTIGASGAIYGLLAANAILFPDRQVWLIPFPVSLPMRVYVMIMAGIAFFGTLGATGDTVSHISHLAGMLVGWIYLRRGQMFFGIRNRITDWKRRRLRRKFEVYMRDHNDPPPPSHPDHWVN